MGGSTPGDSDTTDVRFRQQIALVLQARAGIARTEARMAADRPRARALWRSARDYFVQSLEYRRAIPGHDSTNTEAVEDSLAGAGIAGCDSALAALAD